MADTKISALTDGTTAISTDAIPVARAGANKYITPGYIQTMISAAAVFQPIDADLTALAGLTSAADKGIMFTGSGTAAVYALTAAGLALLDDADTAAQRATLFGATTAITGGGTIELGGFTLTVPATGSAALLATANVFTAAQAITIADSGTSTTTTLATLTHNSSGTPAASFGSRLLFNLDSATVDDRNAIALDVTWVTATDASRKSAFSVSSVTAGGALTEVLRVVDPFSLVTLQRQASFNYSELTAANLWITGTSRFQLSCTDSTNGVNITSGLLTAGTGNSANLVLRAGSTFAVHSLLSDTATNTAPATHVFRHNSSGTPAAGYGMLVQTQLQSSTTADQVVTDDTITWVVATHASRTARRVHAIYDTASRETFREEASGTAPMIGFLGAAAVVRQASAALTNNIVASGTTDQFDDFTNLSVYATDAAAIHADIYQLARKMKVIDDALRVYGFLT